MTAPVLFGLVLGVILTVLGKFIYDWVAETIAVWYDFYRDGHKKIFDAEMLAVRYKEELAIAQERLRVLEGDSYRTQQEKIK